MQNSQEVSKFGILSIDSRNKFISALKHQQSNTNNNKNIEFKEFDSINLSNEDNFDETTFSFTPAISSLSQTSVFSATSLVFESSNVFLDQRKSVKEFDNKVHY